MAEGVGVVRAIGKHQRARVQPAKRRAPIGSLPPGHRSARAERASEFVCERVELARAIAARSADRLGLLPPCPVAGNDAGLDVIAEHRQCDGRSADGKAGCFHHPWHQTSTNLRFPPSRLKHAQNRHRPQGRCGSRLARDPLRIDEDSSTARVPLVCSKGA